MTSGVKSGIKRYGLAILLFGVAVFLSSFLKKYIGQFDVILVLALLIATTWYLGRGPGLTVAILLQLTILLNLRNPATHSLRFALVELNWLVLFLVTVFLASMRKNAEDLLREQREWLRVTLSSIGDAVIATDLKGKVTFINPTAEELTGWDRIDAIDIDLAKIFRIVNEETRETVENPVSKVIREGITVGLANHTILISRNGRECPVDDSGAPIRNIKGEITGVVLVFRDVSDRKRADHEREELLHREQEARERAETTSRIKDEFLATVSHELRTPLTAMLGWSRLLSQGRLDTDASKRAIEVIERNAIAQSQIVNDLLEMSRVITGKMRLELIPIDLAPVLQSAIETLRPTAQAKGITLQASIPSLSVQVRSDPDRMQQIMWNLLSNAIRFTPPNGKVEVGLKQVGSNVEIVVQDTGIGIDPEFLPYVFDRFKQADSSITRKYGGLGLGLAIARSLVELHGGEITAESSGEGMGTTFVIKLPIAEVENVETEQDLSLPHVRALRSTDDHEERTLSLAGLRVLVVDDETDALDLMSVVLEQYGAEVQTASSAGIALVMLPQWRPNVLVSDIGMPGEDGYVFIRKVRSLAPEQGGLTPAAALTAYARMEDKTRALAAGYQIHVAKPVDPKEIVTVVSNLANHNSEFQSTTSH